MLWLGACASPSGEGDAGTATASAGPSTDPASSEWISADQAIGWRRWVQASFAEAAASDRPVLLYLAAPGCDGLFAEPDAILRVVAEERYLPIRANPFHRPDLARRYGAAGWPALAVLRADGRQVAGAVDMPRRHVRLFLSRLHSHLQERPQVVERKTTRARDTLAASGPQGRAQQLFHVLTAQFDPHHAGFRGAVKAPEPLVLQFLLDYYSAVGTSSALQMVDATLDAMLASPVWDSAAGGVCAYSHTPDWQTPLYEKDAADQAGLLRVLARRAGDVVGYRRAAEVLIGYLRRELFDPESGAFRGRQVRLDRGSPQGLWWTDPGLYADRNALLVLSLFEVAPHLDGEGALQARQMATAAAEFLMGRARGAGGLVPHCVGAPGTVAGLLEDQMLVTQALLLAARSTGDIRYARVGAQVFASAETHLFDAEVGAFRDRPALQAPDPLVGSPEWMVCWPVHDGAVPAGNALAASIQWERGKQEWAAELLRRVSPGQVMERRHATYGSALLKWEGNRREEP